jgi:hypothetical protein
VAGVDGPRADPGRSPAEALAEAQAWLDARRPFAAHEVLEDAWRAAPTDERDLWQGLAQLAVGLTHAMRGNPRGAVALLERGTRHLTRYQSTPPHGVDVTGLQRWAGTLLEQVRGLPQGHVPPEAPVPTLASGFPTA